MVLCSLHGMGLFENAMSRDSVAELSRPTLKGATRPRITRRFSSSL
jgi:hypothetical protein